MLVNKLKSWKTAAVALLLLLAVVSVTVFSPWLSSPKAYPGTLEVLNHQKERAIALNVAVTVASTALSAMSEDLGTPVATELAQLSLPLFIILSVLYVEIFLLTTLAWIATTFLIPAACLIAILYLLLKKEKLLDWIKKLVILSITLLVIVPFSASTTARIEETFSELVTQTFDKANHLVEISELEGGTSNVSSNVFLKLKDGFVSLVDTVKNMLSIIVDAVTVLLVTSCVMPVCTALLFLWIIKRTINIDIPVSHLAKALCSRRSTADEDDLFDD